MVVPQARVFSGLFSLQNEELFVLTPEGAQESVSQFLDLMGVDEIQIFAHHLPSDPPNPEVPGFGSCHWNGHCPCGHSKDPLWMFKAEFKGVLKRGTDGMRQDDPLLLRLHMPGHLGRVVIWAEGSVDARSSPEELLVEITGLLEVLSSLRDTMKEDNG